ncbi:MAG: hypothetical protein JJ872_08935 [Marivivens sp.]|nr:hypothetical protein [Marivivens sp.]
MAETVCFNCVLDSTVDELTLVDGVCQYCRGYRELENQINDFDINSYGAKLVETLRRTSKDPDYDCIVGISGGLDSSYLLTWLVSIGVRPYVLHIDTCWDGEVATRNIYNLVNTLGLKLNTRVIDWGDLKIAQRAFFKANLIDCDVPQDHCFTSVLSSVARNSGIRNVISGHNLFMEYVLPVSWSYNSNDARHIRDVVWRQEAKRLVNFPYMSPTYNYIGRKIAKSIIAHRPFLYHRFDIHATKEMMNKKFGWEDYGGKHYESEFTKFFQGDYLVEKFGIDKRKAHYSNLILSGQMTRDEAVAAMEKPTMTELERFRLRTLVRNKLDFDDTEWVNLFSPTKAAHADYKSSHFLKLQKILFK